MRSRKKNQPRRCCTRSTATPLFGLQTPAGRFRQPAPFRDESAAPLHSLAEAANVQAAVHGPQRQRRRKKGQPVGPHPDGLAARAGGRPALRGIGQHARRAGGLAGAAWPAGRGCHPASRRGTSLTACSRQWKRPRPTAAARRGGCTRRRGWTSAGGWAHLWWRVPPSRPPPLPPPPPQPPRPSASPRPWRTGSMSASAGLPS